jgi:DNA-binding NtrC family response regulator
MLLIMAPPSALPCRHWRAEVPNSPVKILVIEDDPAVTRALLRINLGSNYSLEFITPDQVPEHSTSGYAAILGNDQLFESRGEEPPIVRLKQNLQCPVILMTASSSPRLSQAARAAGADAVLQKPFGVSDLRKAFSTALHKDIPAQPQSTDASAPTIETTPQAQAASLPTTSGHVAPEAVFDQLFVELERRQPLEEGLDAFDVVESHLIRRALEVCAGNQSQAARFLGITRNTLRKRIRKYDFGSLLVKDEEPEG